MVLSTLEKKNILSLNKKYSIYAPWYDAKLFKKIVDAMAKPFLHAKVDKVVGLESRGFILGGAVAYKLGCGFVVARKKGKMFKKYSSSDVYSKSFIDYSGKKKQLELAKNEGVCKGERILVVDDRFSTGTQGRAIIDLVEKKRGKIVGMSILLNEMDQSTKKFFKKYNLHSILTSQKNEK
tara:strand:- start:3792 stop:4331 length:540 start_codon:yes stop_codon:yes gene_type:complete